MQTKQTQRLAKKILRERNKKPPMLWREICVKFGILKADGTPDTGLASKISSGEEPAGRELRERLGLRNICFTCQRPFRKPGKKPAIAKSAAESWWSGLAPDDRRRMIKFCWESFADD